MDELSAQEKLAIEEARRLSRKGDIAAAVKIFHTVLEGNNQNPFIYWVFGHAYLNNMYYSDSIDYFRLAIELDERCVPAWGGLGRALNALERWDEAEAAFRRRLELAESANHYVFLAGVLSQQSKYNDAIACCDRALQLDDRQIDALLNQGFAYSSLGLHEKAVECCRRAVSMDCGYDEAHICLGVVLSGANRLAAQ